MSGQKGSNGTADEGAEKPSVTLSSALMIASNPPRAEWLHRPYIERGAMILLVGAEGCYKSFLALHWAMTVASAAEFVVYLSAEGRGLWRRLRAWCLHHYPQQTWSETLNGLPLLALERPLNLSSLGTIQALTEGIDAVSDTRGRPALIVVDTITRNSDGSLERSNEDALLYLNGLDQLIRARYGCAVILIHHIGHQNRDRARGPFALIGNTDANFLIERPDPTRPVVTVRSGRMKDCEPPAPFELEAHVVELDETDEDGKPVTSLVLKGTGTAPAIARPKAAGKNQEKALAALREWAGQNAAADVIATDELSGLLKRQGLQRSRRFEVTEYLVNVRVLTPSVSGHKLHREML